MLEHLSMWKPTSAFKLSVQEEQTIIDIKRRMDSAHYHTRYSASEHLNRLQEMLSRMEIFAAAESLAGHPNWVLQDRMADVRKMCLRLKFMQRARKV